MSSCRRTFSRLQTFSVKFFNVGGKSSRNSTRASLRGVAKGCAVVVVVLSVVVDVPAVTGFVPEVVSVVHQNIFSLVSTLFFIYSVTLVVTDLG